MSCKKIKIVSERKGSDATEINTECLAFSVENKGTAVATLDGQIDIGPGESRSFAAIDGYQYSDRMTLKYGAGSADLLIIKMILI